MSSPKEHEKAEPDAKALSKLFFVRKKKPVEEEKKAE